jgi:hypothetical protein
MIEEAVDVVTVLRDEVKVSEEVLPGVLNAVGVLKVLDATTIIVDALSIAFAVELESLHECLEEDEA